MGETSPNILAETSLDGALPLAGKEVIRGTGATMRRTMDASRLNRIANHAEVRPWLGGEGELSLGEIAANPANHCLILEDHPGGFVITAHGGGIYEVHSLFEPVARRYSLGAMREGMRYMFCETDAFRLVTQVPDSNPAAASLAAKGGFREWFRRENTTLGPSTYMVFELDEWIQRDAANAASGVHFHEGLETAKLLSGSASITHDDDDAHNAAVGAAVRMIQSGNVAKGVESYNRWAVTAGYAPITLLAFNPVTIDVVDAIVQLDADRNMGVLLCR